MGNESQLSPEIQKLTEKIAKDPSSRLFLPLAEEYVKCGMLEEAIATLEEGLKSHPDYVSARVSLGKVYVQKGMVAEAKREFERVVMVHPDNLVAHRKLAHIYKEEGEREKARESALLIVNSNPQDGEMKQLLQELETAPVAPPAVAGEEDASLGRMVTGISPGEVTGIEDLTKETKEENPPPSDRDRWETVKAAQEEASDRGAPPAEPEAYNLGAVSQPDMGTGEAAPEENAGSAVPEADVGSAAPASKEAPQPAVSSEDELSSPALAELYIQQGHYDKGIEVYREILEKNPDQGEVRQKLEDALLLARLLTYKPHPPVSPPPAGRAGPQEIPEQEISEPSPPKEKEADEKVKRLQTWLEGIRKSQGR